MGRRFSAGNAAAADVASPVPVQGNGGVGHLRDSQTSPQLERGVALVAAACRGLALGLAA